LKRIILCLAVGVGLIVACSETQAVTTAAGLSGTYDLAIAGKYVFVTSSDRNELRVLDLESNPRDFVRAPNPLEALSIPVLERPTYLTRDIYYRMVDEPSQDGDGNPIVLPKGEEITGPYIYARSDGAQQISVVSAGASDERNLRELRLLGGTRPEGSPSEPLGFVTAFAARGPGKGTQSILYYATQNASVATLWRQALPGPGILSKTSPLEARTAVLVLPGETVAALLVLPSEPDADSTLKEYVVVATRGTQGTVGRTFRVDAAKPADPIVTYAFPVPVRLLATHPAVANTVWGGDVDRLVPNEATEDETDFRTIKACGIDSYVRLSDPNNPDSPKITEVVQPQRSTLRAGEYVFGVLDESICGGGAACSGVLAVDSVTGQVLLDGTGVPMLPIRVTPGLPTGLTLVAGAELFTRCAEAENHGLPRPLVGMVPSSDGQVSFFDAVKLRPFDLNPDASSVTAITISNAAGEVLNTDLDVTKYVGVELLNGASRNDTYRMVYEGILPAPRNPNLPALTPDACKTGPCTFNVGTPREARFVLLNDLVVLEPGDTACELPVIDKKEVDGVVQVSTGSIPEGCRDRTRFSLRAGRDSALPFAVYSDSRGTEGRISEGTTLTIAGDYYFHPPGFTGQQAPFQVRLTLKLTEKKGAGNRPVRGDQYVASVQSAFSPYIFSPDIGTLSSGLASFRLPGPVSHTRVGELTLAYIAYPSADGILQVNLELLTDNSAQSTGLVPFQ
jgi:hypothetical protein